MRAWTTEEVVVKQKTNHLRHSNRSVIREFCCHLVVSRLHRRGWACRVAVGKLDMHSSARWLWLIILFTSAPCLYPPALLLSHSASPSSSPLPLTMIAFTMSFLLCFSARMALARDTLAWAITSSMSLCSRPPSSTWSRKEKERESEVWSLHLNHMVLGTIHHIGPLTFSSWFFFFLITVKVVFYLLFIIFTLLLDGETWWDGWGQRRRGHRHLEFLCSCFVCLLGQVLNLRRGQDMRRE